MKASNYWNEIIEEIKIGKNTLEPGFKAAEADEEQAASKRRTQNVYAIPEDLSPGATKPIAVEGHCEDNFLALNEEEAIIQKNFVPVQSPCCAGRLK